MNHFMARLIFCFFAEDTDIFNGEGLFTETVEQMSERDAPTPMRCSAAMFRAMNTKSRRARNAQPRLPSWADWLPLCERRPVLRQHGRAALQQIARSYLLHIGSLDWKQDQPGHLRLDDPGRGRRRGARRARHALHQRAEHPEGAEPAFLDDLRRSWRRQATTPASC